jgi:hypothetical protein
MKRFRTLLRAEDGHYLKSFDTHQAAYVYVEYQMGDAPGMDQGAFFDNWGRSMTITDDETGYCLGRYEEPKAPVEIETLDALNEQLIDLSISLGETEAEHLGETARYGDSWPGAQIQIRDAKAIINTLATEIANREAAFVGPIPLTWYQAERFAAEQAMINFVGPEQPFPF